MPLTSTLVGSISPVITSWPIELPTIAPPAVLMVPAVNPVAEAKEEAIDEPVVAACPAAT